MTYTLNYQDNFDEIKSMNTATDINLVLGKDGLPYDLANITDNLITVKVANQNGFIKDLTVNISDYTDEEKTNGTFTLELNEDFMKEFPPDVYYFEVWINTTNNNRVIFPSNDDILPFTVNSNIVNGSDAIPMITFYQVKQDVEATKKLVFEHEAKVEKYISSLDSKKDGVINDINDKIQNYYTFSNNIKATLNSLNSKVFNASDEFNKKINDISTNVSEATNEVTNAGKTVRNSVKAIVTSAKNNISHDINTNSAINLINSGASQADSQITNVVTEAKDKLFDTTYDLKNQLTSLNNNGIRQINTTAGSAAANLTNIARDVTNSGSDTVSTVTSFADSADNNVSNYASSFDFKVTSTTNSLNNYIDDAKYNYSNLNNHVSNVVNSISDNASSAYSHMNQIKDENTKQMVSKAISDFNQSTGTTNTLPQSLKDLSDSFTKHKNITSHIFKTNDTEISNNASLINNVSSVANNASNMANNVNTAKDDIVKSVAEINSEVTNNNSDITSLFSSCNNVLSQANSYTDQKLKKSSDSGSSNENVINLVPLKFTGTVEVTDKGWGSRNDGNVDDMKSIIRINNVKQGDVFWCSCHVDKGDETFINVEGNNYPIDGETDSVGWGDTKSLGTLYHTGQDCLYKYVANSFDASRKHVFFGVGNNGMLHDSNSITCTISNFCITKSKEYVPFSIAESNRRSLMINDISKPNLIPSPSYSGKVSEDDYKVFNIPVQKGKRYWFSCHVDDAANVDTYVCFATSWKNGISDLRSNEFSDAGDSYYSDLTEGGIKDYLKFSWVADRTGIMPVGVTLNWQYKMMLKVSEICITETDNFIPFEMAQENRENIQAVFNTILNNNDTKSGQDSNANK